MPQRKIQCQCLISSVLLIVSFHIQEVLCHPNNLPGMRHEILQELGTPVFSTSSNVIENSVKDAGTVQRGEPFTLTCESDQPIKLKLKDRDIKVHARKASGSFQEYVSIANTTRGEVMYFECCLFDLGTFDANCQYFDLYVKEKLEAIPRIKIPPVAQGDMAELHCDLDPLHYTNFLSYQIHFLWTSPNGTVTECESRNRQFTDKKRSCNFTISNATKAHEGEYACTMTSFNFTAVTRQNLTVYEHPKLIVKALNNSKTEYVNATARWDVLIQSIPDVSDYSLVKMVDHNELPVNKTRFDVTFNDTSVPGKREYVITIYNVTYSDSGNYAFALSNGISREIIDLKLVVTDQPVVEVSDKASVTMWSSAIVLVLMSAIIASIFVCHGKYKNKSMYFKGLEKQYRHWIYFGELKLEKVINQGNFGVVSEQIAKGLLPHERSDKFLPLVKQLIKSKIDGTEIRVAVKSAKTSGCGNAKDLLDKEFKTYARKKLNHPNIVSFYGVSIKNDYPELILEYCELSLLTCLQHCDVMVTPLPPGYSLLKNNTPRVDSTNNVDVPNFASEPKHLVDYARQIAAGMAYLASMRVIHADLAARNVVIKVLREDGNVRFIPKLCDFGVAHQSVRYHDSYQYKILEGTIVAPVNIMPPEVFSGILQSSQSDVWSFGMLLWEMFFLGFREPFQNLSETQIYQIINSERPDLLERPPLAPNHIWQLMQSCWSRLPENRPTFDQIVQVLSQDENSPVLLNNNIRTQGSDNTVIQNLRYVVFRTTDNQQRL